MWEVSWRLNKDCNILTPNFSVFSTTSFSFCWVAQLGALMSQLSAWSGSHCFELPQLTPNELNFLAHRVISLFDTFLLPVSVTFAPNSTRPQSTLSPDIFDRMYLFPDRRLGRRSICYRKLLVHYRKIQNIKVSTASS